MSDRGDSVPLPPEQAHPQDQLVNPPPTERPSRQQAISYWEAIHRDLRGEIKQRIRQRDQYIIQMVVGVGGLLYVASAGQPPFSWKVLIILPAVVIYYTSLILYSYQVHDLQTGYLHDVVEIELARLHNVDADRAWEHYYRLKGVPSEAQKRNPGIRRQFFAFVMWLAIVVTLSILAHVAWKYQEREFGRLLAVGALAYLSAGFWVEWKRYTAAKVAADQRGSIATAAGETLVNGRTPGPAIPPRA